MCKQSYKVAKSVSRTLYGVLFGIVLVWRFAPLREMYFYFFATVLLLLYFHVFSEVSALRAEGGGWR